MMVRNLGTALGAIQLISSLTITNALTIEKRAGVIPSTLPGSWVSQGCWVDVGRTLTQGGYDDNNAMTDESCINYCNSAGFIYAGTEYSSQCYCGNTLAAGSGPAASTDCSMTCTGNATEACGGPNRLNLFWSGTTGPQTNPGANGWQFSGCYTEGTTGRTLPNGATTTGGSNVMTVDLCLSACQTAGYLLAGAEYSGECWCGNAISNGATLAPEGLAGCNMLCNGNHSEYCGGSSRLDVYDYQNKVSLPPYTTIVSTTSKSSTSTTAVVTTSSTKPATTTTVPTTSSTKPSTATTVPTTSSTKPPSTVPTVSTSSNTLTTSTTVSTASSSTSSSCTKHSTSTTVSTASSSISSSCTKSSTSTTVSTASSSISSSCTKSSTSTTVSTASSSQSSTSSVTSNTSKTSASSTAPTTSKTSTSSIVNAAISTTSTTSTSAVPSLAIKPIVGAYTYQGCYTEGTNTRALTPGAFYDYPAMTLEECAADCAGYTYFGVEYGGECYCGNTINAGSVLAPATDCSFTCPGNQYEYCGAGNRLDMYKLTSAATGVSSSNTATGTGTTATGTSTTKTGTTSTSSVAIATVTGPGNWVYKGCWVDGLNGRDLNYQQPDNQQNTVEACTSACAALGYSIAGMEYAVQCFCDNFLYNGAALATDQTTCSTPCPGNTAEMCGAGNRLSLYSTGALKVYQPPAIQTTGLPAGWVYEGCLQDNIPSSQDPNEIISTFPYMVWNNASNTPVACITQCQAFGYNAAGLEYGSECFCGDVENIQIASAPGVSTDPDATQSYTRSAIPQIVADSQCSSVCSGNGSYLCGSGNLMTYYSYQGPTPLYSWQFPTGNAAGEYSLLIGGVVVPLMTTQGVNGKAQFIEKYGSGEPNGTGAYELDLTEINDWALAWRTMTGLETDVFCSAGLTLPDKAGRILTVGGWAGQSNFGIRMYTPDGSAGVFGTNEWQEDSGVLSLQVPRWYPSAMVMANGSIMVIGGEIGSNDAEQPTLELLPATGVPQAGTVSGYSNTTVYLPFLDRTAPFNLYPFVCVVPSGIFVAYYNEASILDEKTFEVIKQLPNMPGAVNDPTGGRTYQLEGAMVLLPQYWPYTDNLHVLICGGSTSNGGYPIDNCITTQPENPNPVWTIERMPSRRVMPCMAGLPDGTYVIVNGAQHGVAGFGLGGDPNYNAVLYDPTKPINQRMSIMANTTVARLYHSEAITLLDGRVMISGSDPTGDYDQPAGEWPEEYRVEVFTPPYLLGNPTRPTFTLSETDWAYNDTITVSINLPSGNVNNIKISMLGSVVSTHGNAMGQRTIFPHVVCSSASSCTITAPPNAHTAPPGWFMVFVLDGPTPAVGQFIRIGKDPGNIGSWPAGLPAFAPLPNAS